jgi:hypothetical protein
MEENVDRLEFITDKRPVEVPDGYTKEEKIIATLIGLPVKLIIDNSNIVEEVIEIHVHKGNEKVIRNELAQFIRRDYINKINM